MHVCGCIQTCQCEFRVGSNSEMPSGSRLHTYLSVGLSKVLYNLQVYGNLSVHTTNRSFDPYPLNMELNWVLNSWTTLFSPYTTFSAPLKPGLLGCTYYHSAWIVLKIRIFNTVFLFLCSLQLHDHYVSGCGSACRITLDMRFISIFIIFRAYLSLHFGGH